MDLYSLDPITFKTAAPIDTFDSLIWTERYNDAGEVTLVVPSNSDTKDFFVEGMFLWTPDSREVALVDTVQDEDGQLTVTGEFLIGFLKSRVFRDSYSSNASAWKLTGTAGNIAATIIQQMCMAGGLITTSVLPSGVGTYEVIPNLTTAATPTGDSMTVAVDYGNVFDAIKAVCDADDLGFTMYPPNITDGTAALSFLTYRGRDLTSDQTVYPVVVFDPAIDSLSDTNQLRSISGYMSAAYAFATGITQAQVGVAYAAGTTTQTGWNRRSLMVDATDLDASDYTSTELTSILNRRAKNALANNNYVRMTDGQVVPQNAFTYGIDYTLGDIVELREGSVASQARVTEYIRAQDNTGEQAYPTLSVI